MNHFFDTLYNIIYAFGDLLRTFERILARFPSIA